MSRIFEALHRAEAERSGADPLPGAESTELLRRVERHTSAELETSILEQPEATESELEARPSRRVAEAIVAKAMGVPVAEEFSSRAELAVAFNLQETEQIGLPLQSRIVCLSDVQSPASEAFRLLGVRLRHLRRNRTLKRVLISSTIPKEGKSTVSVNLACTLSSRKEQKVLLLEGDVRRPSLSQTFGLRGRAGLCEYLEGDRSLKRCLYHLEGQGLWILPAGSSPSNPLKLLQSARLGALMDQLNEIFDWVIIDSPPLLPLADTSVWMRLADGVLLVTRQGTTVKRQLLRGLEALEPKKLIGAVLNASRNTENSDYYYSQPTASPGNSSSPTEA